MPPPSPVADYLEALARAELRRCPGAADLPRGRGRRSRKDPRPGTRRRFPDVQSGARDRVLLLVYVACRRVPAAFHPGYGAELRRYLLLCVIGTGAITVYVLGEAVLVGIRLWAAASLGTVIPILLLAAEIVFVGALAVHLRSAMRRMASVALLTGAGG